MQTEKEYLSLVAFRFSKTFGRMTHAVRQLDDGQLWYRPSTHSNSIGIILQHLSGNLHQWICSAMGGETYQRRRPQEFEDVERASQRELLNRVADLDLEVQRVISQLSPDSLQTQLRIQGFDETVMSALLAALTHCEMHAGQITLLAKLILDEAYEEFWRPANAEQGKE